jgi:hypothetical protein
LRVAAHIVRKVESVQAVDADEQNVLDLVSGIGVLCLQGRREGEKDQQQREAACKHFHRLFLVGNGRAVQLGCPEDDNPMTVG